MATLATKAGNGDLLRNVAKAAGQPFVETDAKGRFAAYQFEALVDRGEADMPAPMESPAQHHSEIHSTNPLECLSGGLRRRAVGVLPKESAVMRLTGAVLPKVNDQWQLQHHDMQTEDMAEFISALIDAAPLQIMTKAV